VVSTCPESVEFLPVPGGEEDEDRDGAGEEFRDFDFLDFESMGFKFGGVGEQDLEVEIDEVKSERAALKKFALLDAVGEQVGMEYQASLWFSVGIDRRQWTMWVMGGWRGREGSNENGTA
jgi:hypothetical protein